MSFAREKKRDFDESMDQVLIPGEVDALVNDGKRTVAILAQVKVREQYRASAGGWPG